MEKIAVGPAGKYPLAAIAKKFTADCAACDPGSTDVGVSKTLSSGTLCGQRQRGSPPGWIGLDACH